MNCKPLLIGALALPLSMDAQVSSDSAGIRISNYRAQKTLPVAFTLSESPVLVIRGSSSDSDVLGTMAITPLRDGSIALAVSKTVAILPRPSRNDSVSPPETLRITRAMMQNASAPSQVYEMHIYDAKGKFLSNIGKYGNDPQQIASAPQRLAELPNGNLLLSTVRAVNSEFTRQGAFVRSVRLGLANPTLGGILGDFSTIAGHSERDELFPAPGTEMPLRRLIRVYARYDDAGNEMEKLPLTSAWTWFPVLGGKSETRAPWPVHPEQLISAGGNTIWKIDPITWELYAHDVHAKLNAIVRPAIPARLSGAVLGTPVEQREIFQIKMIVDDAGRLWMDSPDNNVLSINEFEPRTYLVFDPTGEQLGSVLMHRGFRPVTVHKNKVYGMMRPSPYAGHAMHVYELIRARE